MRILAIDTATRSCSVAVADEDKLLAETTLVSSETHSRHVMTMIDAVLQMSGMQIGSLDGIAVTEGPGSFTGLRIGVSVAKGLASVNGKPIVGVSSLDALATQAAGGGLLTCAVVDARKNEVYACRYRNRDGVVEAETAPDVLPIEAAIAGIHEPCMFIGDGAILYRQTIQDKTGTDAWFAPPYQHTIRSSTVAFLGIKRFQKGDTDDVEAFVPFYIRKSDAQINIAGGIDRMP